MANIRVRQGRNLWRLWRTDRDGASRSQVVETVGPAVARMLREAQLHEPWDIVRTRRTPPTWRIGAARPVVLTQLVRYEVGKPGPAMHGPRGTQRVASRETYPGDTLPTVRGQRPWWVLLDVWWRTPDASITWPGFRVDWGIRRNTVVDADWVLERALWVPPRVESTPDPGDTTALEEHGGHAAEAMTLAAPPALLLAAAALYLYLESKW